MKIISTYSAKIRHYNKIFKETLRIYRTAVGYLIDVADQEWELFIGITTENGCIDVMESLINSTKKHPNVPYDFNRQFPKFPSYLRRSAIKDAVGRVSSYRSNLAKWETSGRTNGKPGKPTAGNCFPCMYKGNMFKETGTYTAMIKVYINKNWSWLNVSFRKGDVDYILHHCQSREKLCPSLVRRGKEWSLDFPFKETRVLDNIDIFEQKVLAADLGIINACTCNIMTADGAVHGRHFLKLPVETDRLDKEIGRIKKAQQHGDYHIPAKWAAADGTNTDIARKTADFIIGLAMLYSVDVIVFEHLELKHGSKKQKLHLWRAKEVQGLVEHKAHRLGIRIRRVCARNTSRLAFDGSGYVQRGTYRQDGEVKYNYSVCVFPNNKVYNCDLNASYNIGARYFIREIVKSLPVKERLALEAKVPSVAKRSTSTLSTLISLNAETMLLAA